VPYLSRAEVATTVTAIAACSAPNSRLIVNFTRREPWPYPSATPGPYATAG
jgi:O-methyltransferase involved in polyketide biosynthesis